MRIGLVLEGGAMRGMYTAGVLDAFLDNNIEINGIIGVSAGALFGINYCSKQRGRVFRYNSKYIKDRRYMGLRSLITTGNIVNKDFTFYEVPLKLDVFDEKAFEDANVDFYATVTNVETGEAEYIKIEKATDQIEVFRATAAMPFVSKIVEIGGKQYLDGGIADSIPLDKCKELGYDKIIVVLTRPLEYRKKKTPKFISKMKYRKYPKLVDAINNRYKNYNEAIERVIDSENKKEIFVIRPSRFVKIKRIEKDKNRLREMYQLGISDCRECLDELKKYLK